MSTIKKINWGVLVTVLIAMVAIVILLLLGSMDIMTFKDFMTILVPVFVSSVPVFNVKTVAPVNLTASEAPPITPDQKQSLFLILARLIIALVKVFVPEAKQK